MAHGEVLKKRLLISPSCITDNTLPRWGASTTEREKHTQLNSAKHSQLSQLDLVQLVSLPNDASLKNNSFIVS